MYVCLRFLYQQLEVFVYGYDALSPSDSQVCENDGSFVTFDGFTGSLQCPDSASEFSVYCNCKDDTQPPVTKIPGTYNCAVHSKNANC